MASEATIEPAPVAIDDSREPGRTHWIAQERLDPGPPPNWWKTSLIALAAAAFILLVAVADEPGQRIAAEQEFLATDGFLQAWQAWLGLTLARYGSALATAGAVAATGVIARRILHSNLPSIMAAALVAIDGAMLVHGRMATPVATANAAALIALALFLSKSWPWHWWGAAAFAYACFLEPAHLLWAVPLSVLVLARGHIYAAPQHAFIVGLQTVLIPATAALVGIAGASSLRDGCYQATRAESIFLLRSIDLGGVIAPPNIVTWFAGLGALIYLGGGAAAHIFMHFRLQRLPGRLQIRLPEGLNRMQGRALWLLALALFAPTPLIWVAIFAISIAAAVVELGKDAQAFGAIVGVVAVIFALAYSIQNLDLLTLASPTGGAPWTNRVSCGG